MRGREVGIEGNNKLEQQAAFSMTTPLHTHAPVQSEVLTVLALPVGLFTSLAPPRPALPPRPLPNPQPAAVVVFVALSNTLEPLGLHVLLPS
jgi:hypothetical protein